MARIMLTAAMTLACPVIHAAQIVYPSADGTLADGGVFGAFDGAADSWTWDFKTQGFPGAVSLTTETPASTLEHRMVCEYDLRSVSITAPLTATLTFTTRSAGVFPFPDVTLHVYSYPADMIELPSDFAAQPATLRGAATVTATQGSSEVTIDVTDLISSVLIGSKRVGFRFQIDPDTPHTVNQVFIDALDDDPARKPYLTIRSGVPGDADEDGDADVGDYAILTDCLAGPGATPQPSTPGVTATDCLWTFDRDTDADVDLEDLSDLLGFFAH